MMRGSVAGGQSWRETSHSRHMNGSPNSANGWPSNYDFYARQERSRQPWTTTATPCGSMAGVRLLIPVVIMSLCTRSRGAEASLTAHGALPVVLRLRGGVTGNELRARAAQLRRREPQAPEPKQAEATITAVFGTLEQEREQRVEGDEMKINDSSTPWAKRMWDDLCS